MNAHQQPRSDPRPPIGDPSARRANIPATRRTSRRPASSRRLDPARTIPIPAAGRPMCPGGRDNRTSPAGQANPAGRESPTIRP